MNKMWSIAVLGLAVIAVLAVGAFAYGRQVAGQGMMRGASLSQGGAGTYHEQMESIVETGTFADLEELRTQTGARMVPWVVDEETFAQWQERHAQMEELYGDSAGYGKKAGTGGRGRGGGCPMMDVEA